MGYLDDLLYQEQNIIDNANETLAGKADLKSAYLDAAGVRKQRDLGIISDVVPESIRPDRFANQDYLGNGIYHDPRKGPVNDLSLKEISSIEDQAYRERGVIRNDENGLKELLNPKFHLNEYLKNQGESTAFLYDGKGKGEFGNEREKIGLARYGVEPRYVDGLAEQEGYRIPGSKPYGFPSGELGIDSTTATEKEFTGTTADNLEALKHNNINYLNSRLHMDDGSNLAAARRDLLGSGASEYYDPTLLPARTPSGEIPEAIDSTQQTPAYNNALESVLGKEFETTNDPLNTFDATTGLSEKDKYLLRAEQEQADKEGWNGKPIMQMSTEEFNEYEKIRNNDQLNQGYFSDDGLPTTFVKKIAAYTGSSVFSLADLGGDIASNLGESLMKLGGKELTDKQKAYLKQVGDFFDVPSNQKNWEREFKVNQKFSDKAHKDLTKYVDNEDYMGAFGSIFSNFGAHMSDSLPEMMSMVNLPLFASAINRRVSEQSKAFEKKAGREATSAELGLMASLNFIILGAEKLAVVPGLKAPFEAFTNIVMKRITGESASIIGQVVRSTAATGVAVGVEGVQEPLDQLNENFWMKGGSGVSYSDDATVKENIQAFSKASWDKLASGEVLDKKGAIAASIAGMGIGAGLSGGQNAVTGAIESNRIIKTNNRVTAARENAQDASFSRTRATQRERINNIDNLTNQIDRIDNMDNNDDIDRTTPEFGNIVGRVVKKFGKDYDLKDKKVKKFVETAMDGEKSRLESEKKIAIKEFDAVSETMQTKIDSRDNIESEYNGDMDALAEDLTKVSEGDNTAGSKIKDLFSKNGIAKTITNTMRGLNSDELQTIMNSPKANAEVKAKAKYLIAKRKQENSKSGSNNYNATSSLANQGNLADSFQNLRKVVGEAMGRKEITDTRDVDVAMNAIDRMEQRGFISPDEATDYRNRVNANARKATKGTSTLDAPTDFISAETMADKVQEQTAEIERLKAGLETETDEDRKQQIKERITTLAKALQETIKNSGTFGLDKHQFDYRTLTEDNTEDTTDTEAGSQTSNDTTEDTGTTENVAPREESVISDELKALDMNNDRDTMTPDELVAHDKKRGELLKELDDARALKEEAVKKAEKEAKDFNDQQELEAQRRGNQNNESSEEETTTESEPEATVEEEPEMTVAEQLENGFESLEGGAEIAMRQRVADQLNADATIEYNNEAAIDAAIANPSYEVEVIDNADGSRTAKVIGVLDKDGNWVASKETKDKMEAEKKKAERKVSEDDAISVEDQTDGHGVEDQGQTQEAQDAANAAANLFNCN